MFANSGTPKSSVSIARFGRGAAVIAQLAAPKPRQSRSPPAASAYCGACQGVHRGDSTESMGDGGRVTARFHAVLVWTWVALLLLVVGYAVAEGEHMLAKLETLKVLAAYSTGVRRLVRPDLVAPAPAAQPRQSSNATRVP